MADGWIARVATAAAAAAGTGAAQLGLGYGLGVVVWPVSATPDDSAWLGSLGWATWITASATVFGAVLGSRVRGGPGPRSTGPWRFALAACAALGALVSVALIALPARAAVRADAYPPQVIAGGYAAVGLLLGLIIAYWAISSRSVTLNLILTAVWLWALAITAIVVELTVHRDSATYLTSWQFAEAATGGRYGTIHWPSALLTLAAAFAIGVLAAFPAARRGDLGTGTATSGVAGPLLVASAFLALAPRLTGALGAIESAYLIAPYAVLAGLAGSAVAVTTARTLAARRRARDAAAGSRSRASTADDVPAVPATAATAAAAPPQPAKGRRFSLPGRAKVPAQHTRPADGTSTDIAPADGSSTAAGAPEPRSGSATADSSATGRPTRAASTQFTSSASDAYGSNTPTPGSSDPASASAKPGHATRTSGEESDSPWPGNPTPASSSQAGGSHTAEDHGASRAASSPRKSGTGSRKPAERSSAAPAAPNTAPAAPNGGPAPSARANRSSARPAAGLTDPEIAEAARPGRARARKAESTVTPPPAAPAVAKINSERPTGG